MKVLIVDDHPVARRGLTVIVRDSLKDSEVLEAPNAQTALDIAERENPELVLVDARIPDSMPPSEFCRRLRALVPHARIAVVTAFDDAAELRACLAAGATGCLLKDTSEIDLGAALNQLLAGEIVIDPRIANRLAQTLVEHGGQSIDRLTGREHEVLILLSRGLSNRAIAEALFLSEATVKGYVTSLLEKLSASSRLEAVVRAQQFGLV